jgi:hypothetical protein
MAEVAAFFGDVRQLGALSPAEIGLRTRGEPPAMAVGAALVHGMHLGPIPMTWRGRIVAMQPGEAFVDVQDSGPYSCWWHLHRFEALGPDAVYRFIDLDKFCKLRECRDPTAPQSLDFQLADSRNVVKRVLFAPLSLTDRFEFAVFAVEAGLRRSVGLRPSLNSRHQRASQPIPVWTKLIYS